MTRMREVDQPERGPGPVAAHEWEPLPGSCRPGTVAVGAAARRAAGADESGDDAR